MPAITIPIETNTLEGYNLFVKCKSLPSYTVNGNVIETDEISYSHVFGSGRTAEVPHINHPIEFDYQSYVVKRALEKERFAAFLDCGLGKTIIELMFIHDVINKIGGKGIIYCPLSVVEDIQRECNKLYGYRMSNLRKDEWVTPIAITNYEGMKNIDMRFVNAVVLDESSILKSGDGQICKYLTETTINVRFKLACSATPSPNDQTEYASHAVFLGISSTLKSFYSKFFVKDGTTWRMKPHAKDAFYDFLRAWCCYIQSPSSIGFEKGAELGCEPNYIIQNSFPSQEYYQDGTFLSSTIDLSHSRKVFGDLRSDKKQDRFKKIIESISNKKTIIWCGRNKEEMAFLSELNAKIINGSTPYEKRVEIVDAFKNGEIQVLISKPSVLGFGVNIQEADQHIFSGYNFSFEQFYQAVRRSHRFGRMGVLDVIIPVSEPETPVWNTLRRKLDTFKEDVLQLQSRFFNEQQELSL